MSSKLIQEMKDSKWPGITFPDLILSDVLMPERDGATLLRDIRRDPELKSTQVVLMTGSPDMVTPHKDMEEWPDDFLLKPVGLQRLLSCVQARVRSLLKY